MSPSAALLEPQLIVGTARACFRKQIDLTMLVSRNGPWQLLKDFEDGNYKAARGVAIVSPGAAYGQMVNLNL